MRIRALIKERADQLTTSERRVANAILADYPFAGLVSIVELAAHTHVSAPSITRFVHKLGCAGYQEFQRELIDELKEMSSSPIDLKQSEQALADEGFPAEYFSRIAGRLDDFAKAVQTSELETICTLLGDQSRTVYLLGGRISDSLARFFHIHLSQLRPRTFHLPTDVEVLPDAILRMRRQDVVMILDFRRYQPNLAKIAEMIAGRAQSQIVLITDKWISPVSRHSAHVIPIPVETGTAWDTYVAAFALLEAMVVRISDQDWKTVRHRIEAWDDIRFTLTDHSDPEAEP